MAPVLSKAQRARCGPGLLWSFLAAVWTILFFGVSLGVQFRSSKHLDEADMTKIAFGFGKTLEPNLDSAIIVQVCGRTADTPIPRVSLHRISPWPSHIGDVDWNSNITARGDTCRVFPARTPARPRRSSCSDDARYFRPDIGGEYEIRIDRTVWSNGRTDNSRSDVSVSWQKIPAGRVEEPVLAYDSHWLVGGPSPVNCESAATVAMMFVCIPILLVLHSLGLGGWWVRRKPFKSQQSKERCGIALVYISGINVMATSILWLYLAVDAELIALPCIALLHFAVTVTLFVQRNDRSIVTQYPMKQRPGTGDSSGTVVVVNAVDSGQGSSSSGSSSIDSSISSSSSGGGSSSSSISVTSSSDIGIESTTIPSHSSGEGTAPELLHPPEKLYIQAGSLRDFFFALEVSFLALVTSGFALAYTVRWYRGVTPNAYQMIMPWPIVFMGISMLLYWACVPFVGSIAHTEPRDPAA